MGELWQENNLPLEDRALSSEVLARVAEAAPTPRRRFDILIVAHEDYVHKSIHKVVDRFNQAHEGDTRIFHCRYKSEGVSGLRFDLILIADHARDGSGTEWADEILPYRLKKDGEIIRLYW